MQNLYPLFEQNRILKKELLWSLRDYSFAHVQLEYQEYGQGILQGCDITVQGDQLVVGSGIIKYGKFICLVIDEERIPYQASEKVQYLKIKVEVDRRSPDYIEYRTELILNYNAPEKDKEFELCRFNLRAGAQLRENYKDFADMQTEYDTINLIHADWGGIGGKTLAPAITRYFAKTVLASENSQWEELPFAYMCLNQPKAISETVISTYISRKIECSPKSISENHEKYEAMCSIVQMVQYGANKRANHSQGKHKILVD